MNILFRLFPILLIVLTTGRRRAARLRSSFWTDAVSATSQNARGRHTSRRAFA